MQDFLIYCLSFGLAFVILPFAQPIIEKHQKNQEKIKELEALNTEEAKEEIGKLKAQMEEEDSGLMVKLVLIGFLFIVLVCYLFADFNPGQ